MMPKVSVLIPTYNYARFLAEAIETVQAQDFRDFELLIVDDCSQDNSAEVVANFSRYDLRIRFLANPVNLGMVQNWNHCLAMAQGKYVKFLFGDDKLNSPQALGKMVAMLDENPTASVAASARLVLDEKSNRTDLWARLPNGLQNGRAVIARCLLRNHNYIGEPTAVMFRKAAAQRGFNPAYRQLVDLEMWFHLLEDFDLVYTREPLCAFRQHAAQQTAVNHISYSFKEQLMLISEYGTKPWIRWDRQLDILYRAHRDLNEKPEAKELLLALEKKRLGRSRATYLIPWIKYRLKRPFENMRRSWQKRTGRELTW
jgi:glycosyltransferase involved in cell wall biosynthesis